MHPSIALQAAELELEREQNPHGHHDGDEGQRWREIHLPPPATFLHFAPRWHQRRRTMTGVMAGYFDPPPRRNEPLPVIPGAHALLARTAAPAISEEELERMERELRKRRRAKAAAKRITVDLIDAHDAHDNADIAARVIVAENPGKNGTGRGRSTNRSSTRSRSDSPLTTDFKLVSEESTPPLTPLSSRSDFSVRLHLEDGKPMDTKNKVKAKPDKRSSKTGFPTILDTPPDIVRSVAELRNGADTGSVSGSGSKTSTAGGDRRSSSGAKMANPRKRKFSEIERPNQRSRTQMPVASTDSNPKSKPKTRPGWKGWVEVEGSPEPMTKLINLDAPLVPLEKRTRSGKVVPPEKLIVGTRAPRGRPSVPRSSTGADGSSIPPTESTDGGDVPLGAISGNATPLPADGNAAAEV